MDATRRIIVTFSQRIFVGITAYIIVIATPPSVGGSEELRLGEPDPTACYLIQTTLKADGHLKVDGEGESNELPIRVWGSLRYRQVTVDSPANKSPLIVRLFQAAKADIVVDGRPDSSELSPLRRLIALREIEGDYVAYSPQGPLTRGDLELISVQCDPAIVRQLLPTRSLKLGESWRADEKLLADVCGLEAITASDVKCKLLSARRDVAEIQLEGKAEGISLSAKSELQIEGTLTFDRTRNSLSRISVTIQEKRDAGLFAPGFDMEAHIESTISPARPPKELSAESLAGLRAEPESAALAIEFASPTMGIALVHQRDWRVTMHRRDLLVMRLVRDGTFVAQCNVTPAGKASEDREKDATKFQSQVAAAVGKNAGQIDEISTAQTELGTDILRVTANGQSGETPITWVYYLLTQKDGTRMAVVFTLASEQLKAFGGSDHDLIGSLRMIEENRSAEKPNGQLER